MPVPVITVAQMREWERVTWSSGVKQESVMRCAGQAGAEAAELLTRPGQRILFLAGKGHNGDDTIYGYDAVKDRVRELVRVIDPEPASSEIQAQLALGPSLVVDGLFGIGLNRPLSDAWMKLIEQINRPELPI